MAGMGKQRPGRRAAAARAFFDVGWTLGNVLLWVSVALLAGLPVAALGNLLRVSGEGVGVALGLEGFALSSFQNGLMLGYALVGSLLCLFVVPLLWRTFSRPALLRGLAYTAIVIWTICAGLAVPSAWVGWQVTWYLAGAGTAGWWVWQKRWRGAGVAPSPLAGVLRPDIHSGQIWFAVVAGSQETKIRPVMVVGSAPEGRWKVLYFTTRKPKPHLAERYLEVVPGSLRGLPRENWVALRDVRELPRNQFRSYCGLAPGWVYEQACETAGLARDAHALVIEEDAAGERGGPLERMLRRIFALRTVDRELRESVSENIVAILKLPLWGSRRKPGGRR